MQEMISGQKPLTAFRLKLIALAAMVIDHVGAVLLFPPLVNSLMRGIGRMAFPIYAFLVAEGCRYTRSRKKYMLRLGRFALVSEIPFDLAFVGNISFLAVTNVYYTLFLSVVSIHIWETFHKRPLAVLAILSVLLLAEAIQCDYSSFGVLLVFLLYLAKSRKAQITVLAAGMIFLYGFGSGLNLINWIASGFSEPPTLYGALLLGFAMLGVALVHFYNGQRGRKIKWAFYAAYPVHLAVLAALRAALGL